MPPASAIEEELLAQKKMRKRSPRIFRNHVFAQGRASVILSVMRIPVFGDDELGDDDVNLNSYQGPLAGDHLLHLAVQ